MQPKVPLMSVLAYDFRDIVYQSASDRQMLVFRYLPFVPLHINRKKTSGECLYSLFVLYTASHTARTRFTPTIMCQSWTVFRAAQFSFKESHPTLKFLLINQLTRTTLTPGKLLRHSNYNSTSTLRQPVVLPKKKGAPP